MERRNLIDVLKENDMLFFVLGSLASAESLKTKKDCLKANKTLLSLENDIKTSILNNEEKDKITDMVNKIKTIINTDIERLSKH